MPSVLHGAQTGEYSTEEVTEGSAAGLAPGPGLFGVLGNCTNHISRSCCVSEPAPYATPCNARGVPAGTPGSLKVQQKCPETPTRAR